jgi:carbamoyltransferase
LSSIPSETQIEKEFSSYIVTKPANLIDETANLLHDGHIIAWIQGRSECGPRALGNRSILASPLKSDLKNFLNQHIKFREEFRPYGCTVTWERAHEFFATEKGFENPFMSFAVGVREECREKLRDVSHVDGTSRMQTLHPHQNEKFHSLLTKMGELSGLPVLLNTSLNVMNEPIVETLDDAKRFFEQSKVEVMVFGDHLIKKSEILHV